MIIQREFRVGNLCLKYGVETEIGLIHFYDMMNNPNEVRKYTPIPLTEEWLVDFGFSPTTCSDKPNWSDNYHDLTYYNLELNEDKYYDLSLLSSYIENEYIYVELFPYSNPKVKFVHELQNLYFVLTRKELKKI